MFEHQEKRLVLKFRWPKLLSNRPAPILIEEDESTPYQKTLVMVTWVVLRLGIVLRSSSIVSIQCLKRTIVFLVCLFCTAANTQLPFFKLEVSFRDYCRMLSSQFPFSNCIMCVSKVKLNPLIPHGRWANTPPCYPANCCDLRGWSGRGESIRTTPKTRLMTSRLSFYKGEAM